VLVTRKGQVTIPVSKRKKYGIREGMRVLVKDSNEGILIRPITPIEDLAGVDARKVSLEQMRKKLDDIRSHDRY
jgi:AbrB family looped-hinge helix DNA binding protein